MKIKDYILEVGGFNDRTNWGELAGVGALREQVQAVMGDINEQGEIVRTVEQAGEHLAHGGQWAVYNEDAKNDLTEVFGPKHYIGADESDEFDRYCKACGLAVAEILEGE